MVRKLAGKAPWAWWCASLKGTRVQNDAYIGKVIQSGVTGMAGRVRYSGEADLGQVWNMTIQRPPVAFR